RRLFQNDVSAASVGFKSAGDTGRANGTTARLGPDFAVHPVNLDVARSRVGAYGVSNIGDPESARTRADVEHSANPFHRLAPRTRIGVQPGFRRYDQFVTDRNLPAQF